MTRGGDYNAAFVFIARREEDAHIQAAGLKGQLRAVRYFLSSLGTVSLEHGPLVTCLSMLDCPSGQSRGTEYKWVLCQRLGTG